MTALSSQKILSYLRNNLYLAIIVKISILFILLYFNKFELILIFTSQIIIDILFSIASLKYVFIIIKIYLLIIILFAILIYKHNNENQELNKLSQSEYLDMQYGFDNISIVKKMVLYYPRVSNREISRCDNNTEILLIDSGGYCDLGRGKWFDWNVVKVDCTVKSPILRIYCNREGEFEIDTNRFRLTPRQTETKNYISEKQKNWNARY